MTNGIESLPWFRVKFADGREVEVHSPKAIEIYEQTLAELIVTPHDKPSDSRGGTTAPVKASLGEDVPSISATGSTQENLRLLLATPWASQGRSLAEFVTALESNAVRDASKNVSSYLARLVKAGVARRLKEENGYRYYPIPGKV